MRMSLFGTSCALLLWSMAAGGQLAGTSEKVQTIATGRWDAGCPCNNTDKSDCCPPYSVEVVTRPGQVGATVLLRTKADGGKPVFEMSKDAHFLGMFPTRDSGGNLVLLWIGGPAYTVSVLHAKDGHVREVLSARTESMPEWLRCSAEEPTMLSARWEWKLEAGARVKRPTQAVVFRWRGDTYAESGRVAWDERFANVCAN